MSSNLGQHVPVPFLFLTLTQMQGQQNWTGWLVVPRCQHPIMDRWDTGRPCRFSDQQPRDNNTGDKTNVLLIIGASLKSHAALCHQWERPPCCFSVCKHLKWSGCVPQVIASSDNSGSELHCLHQKAVMQTSSFGQQLKALLRRNLTLKRRNKRHTIQVNC